LRRAAKLFLRALDAPTTLRSMITSAASRLVIFTLSLQFVDELTELAIGEAVDLGTHGTGGARRFACRDGKQ
jgi:hypothetical protein